MHNVQHKTSRQFKVVLILDLYRDLCFNPYRVQAVLSVYLIKHVKIELIITLSMPIFYTLRQNMRRGHLNFDVKFDVIFMR